VRRHPQGAGDLLVGAIAGDQAEDLVLPRGQPKADRGGGAGIAGENSGGPARCDLSPPGGIANNQEIFSRLMR
jgi:hypothetical protein